MYRYFNAIVIGVLLVLGPVSAPAFAGLEDILYENGTITDIERNKIKADKEKEEAERARTMDVSAPAEKKKTSKYPDMNSHFKGGLRFKSDDGAFEFKVGGRVQSDYAWINTDDTIQDEVGSQSGGSEFRRMRMYMAGKVYDNVTWKNQVDFADGIVDFKDVYIGVHNLPGVGNLKIGHFKEPFGLEMLTSSKHITFMERSQTNIFDPERNTGFMLYNTALKTRMTLAAGIFKNAGDQGEAFSADGTHYTGRITGLPLYKDKGKQLVHLGVGFTHRDVEDDEVRFRARPEVHLTDRFIDTGTFMAQDESRVGLEAATVLGPFSAQGEYEQSWTNNATNPDGVRISPNFKGFYAYASYFITGESRAYKASNGAFAQVKPTRNFGKDGFGAWEAAVRYSQLDLTDDTIGGGEMDNVTLGLNWHLNPNTRFQFNYVHSKVNFAGVGIADGAADMVQTRFQIEF